VKLEWQRRQYENAKLRQWLSHWIYKDQTLIDLEKPGLIGGLGVFAASLIVAIPKDIARARRRKNGRRLKGPELVTSARFNRSNRSDGIGFVQQRSLGEKLTGRGRVVRIPRSIESSHILIMGDTGTGKSVLTRRILLEVERRINRSRYLNAPDTAVLIEELSRDRKRLETLKQEGASRRAEAEARLQMIEAASSRGASWSETNYMLRRLDEGRKHVPLGLESFRAEQELREDAERELRKEMTP